VRPARTSGVTDLLERDGEVRLIDDLLGHGGGGVPLVIVFEGPAGIGKSRLLAETRARAEARGARVLTARASALEQEFSFGVVRQLVEPFLSDRVRRNRWFAGPAAAAARVFEPPDEETAQDVSFGTLHGLFWLVSNAAAESRVVLAIDDLQWCDRASLRFLAFLVGRLEGVDAVVATAVRTGDPNIDPLLHEEITQDPAARLIQPRSLSERAVGELVTRELGPGAEPRFSLACYEATGGNPLLLGELLKTLRSERIAADADHVDVIRDLGPRAVSRSVLVRLARLSADAVVVARAIAVLGDGATDAEVAALADLPESRVADAVGSLTRAEILRDEGRLGYVHPLVREAVYRELKPSMREQWHARAAELLHDRGASAEVVAAHLSRAPATGHQWAASVFRDAGLAAVARGDAESAVAHLRQGVHEAGPAPHRPLLLLELGMAEAGSDAVSAVEHLQAAYADLHDPLLRAQAARVLTRMLLFTGPAQRAVEAARRAAADLPAQLTEPRRVLEALELYSVAFGADVPDAAARLAEVRAGGVGDGIGARILSAVAAWELALGGGSADECIAIVSGVLAGGKVVVADPGFGTVIAGAVLGLAEHDAAPALWDAAMVEARRIGALRTVCIINIWAGFTWLQRGELMEAANTLGEAAGQIPTLEVNEAGMAYIAAMLARTRIEQGDLDGARAAVALGIDAAPGSDSDSLLRRSRAELALAERDWTRARTETIHSRDRRGSDNPSWSPWRSAEAVALGALDGSGDRSRREDAVALVEEEVALARQWGAPGALGRALRIRGSLTERRGLAFLEEAVAVTEGTPARLEHAKSLVAFGSALRRARRRTAAREPLRRGLELATRCGAASLADRAREEAVATGARPRRDVLTGPDALTPSERRVAELAAEGAHNRDIAQVLYVAPKTVEVHLTSVYRKLGIASRAGLSAALAGGPESSR
jgi:DNA-binding CsgD family transcriptional regulator/tetratricopeptide (TPR) repeat protein